MSEEMIAFATFANTIEAEMARNRLAEEGIPSFVMGDTSGIAGARGIFGEVRLLVAESSLERAAAILHDTNAAAVLRRLDLEEPALLHTDSGSTTTVKFPDWTLEPPVIHDTATQGALRSDRNAEDLPISKADELATRAWKAAIIGFFVVAFGHLYSISCLLELQSMDRDLSPAATRKMYGALIIDGLVVAFLLLLFYALLGSR